jgi:hypothetical protein
MIAQGLSTTLPEQFAYIDADPNEHGIMPDFHASQFQKTITVDIKFAPMYNIVRFCPGRNLPGQSFASPASPSAGVG